MFLNLDPVGILAVLTHTILIRYEFNSITTFVSKEKNDILIKLDENYDCVFKIFSSTKIICTEPKYFTEKCISG